MRKFLASLVVIALVLMLLVPAVSFAGGRGGYGHGGYRGGGHVGLGGLILGTALGVVAGEVIYDAFAPAYRAPAYYYQPETMCIQQVPIYRERYDYRTGEYYSVRVGWREVAVPCR